MRLAFCLFNYFPYGGLERNFKAVAEACAARGHEIDVYTMGWMGDVPDDFNLEILPARKKSNHRRAEAYLKCLSSLLAQKTKSLTIGFNKIPGLDLYYAGDTCYRARIERERSSWSRLSPRYRSFSRLEEAVFSPDSHTQIIYLAEKEKQIYQQIYHTPESRFHYAPPGVDKELIRSCLDNGRKGLIRKELGLSSAHTILLMIGSNFQTKGVDRAIEALASLPKTLTDTTFLVVVGSGSTKKYRKLAARHGIGQRVFFMGGRDDVPSFLADADLVMQPSRNENTGNPIVEAITAGVPVLATDTCGFSVHIKKSGAGLIVPSTPFEQNVMNRLLRELLVSLDRKTMREKALAYSEQVDLYGRIPKIVEIIEATGAGS